jgi:hypothetical protein
MTAASNDLRSLGWVASREFGWIWSAGEGEASGLPIGQNLAMSKDRDELGISLEVPSFFSPGETTDALRVFADALKADVQDDGTRRELSSAQLGQAIQLALHVAGDLSLGILGHAGWAAIEAAYCRFRERYPGRPISIEIVAEDDDGLVADYSFSDGSDEAIRAIPGDLKRGIRGTRVRFDVDEGWLTYEEAQDKKYGTRR